MTAPNPATANAAGPAGGGGGPHGLVAGVDVATAEVRAVAVDAAGRARAAGRAALPAPATPQPGEAEQDGGAWWPAAARALAELTEHLGAERQALEAISVCATSGTVAAVDAAGEPLRPALAYADQRAGHEAGVAQEAAAERWAALGIAVQPSFGLPKWAWLLRHAPDDRIVRLAHAGDVVVARLVGARADGDWPATDWSHALKSGYDPWRGEWADEAMAALGIPRALLPEVRRPTEPVGVVAGEAARATGLPTGCAVRLGMTDGCAAQLAAGASAPGQWVSVLGSTLVLKGASHRLVTDAAGAVYSHRHPGGWWLPGGASNTGGRALTAGFGDRDLATLDALAARHGPASDVVYPLVGRGERFPFAVADAEAFTLGEPSDDVARYRATLEGVAFVERLAYDRLAGLGAPAEPPIRVTGGGSASHVWNRIRATTLGASLIAVPAASTALGAAMLAAAGSLHPDLATATAAMAPAGEWVQPDDGQRDALEASYQRFVAALVERGWVASP